ncbi:MAG TPA: FtsW/RodA/SpoVE family cell cycle protein [Pirellulales bacterium]
MNRLWQQLAIATNWPVLAAIGVLCAMGIISIAAQAPDEALKQLAFLGIGIGLMAVVQAMNYQVIGRFAWVFLIGSLVLVLYTVVGAMRGGATPLPLVRPVNGAYAWLRLGSMSFEPSEVTKIAYILVMARYLRFRTTYRTLKGLIPPFALTLLPMALIMKQPDLGVAVLFLPTLFVMLFVAGAKVKHLVSIVAIGMAMLPVLWLLGKPDPNRPAVGRVPALMKSYQWERVKSLLSDDPAILQGGGFQQEHALIAMGSGGFAGKGLGQVVIGKKVPEAHNDMIFCLIGEQFGFIGSAILLGAYVVLFASGVEIAAATKEPFGKLIAVGVVAMLAAQTFVNLGVATRMLPVTGITLPFVSSGGSSLLANFMAAGLLLNVGQNRPLVMARRAFEY